MATLASLNLVLSATSAAFVAGVKRAQNSVTALGGSVTGLTSKLIGWGSVLTTVAAGAGMTALVKNSFDAIDANAKLSDRLGITTETLAGLQHAGKLAGVDVESLTGGLEKMLKTLGQAYGGSKQAIDALDAAGVSLASIEGKSPDEIFGLIADGLVAIKDPATRAAAAMGIFGKSGQGLLPLMLSGSEGIKAAQAEAAKLGITFSRLDAAKVEAANDSLTRLGQLFVGIANTVAVQLSPYITALTKYLIDLATSGEGMGARVVGVFEMLASGIAKVADFLYLFGGAFHVVRAGAVKAISGIIDAINLLGRGIVGARNQMQRLGKEAIKGTEMGAAGILWNKLVDKLPGGDSQWSDVFSDFNAGLKSVAEDELQKFDKAFAHYRDGTNGKAVSSFFAKIRRDAQKAAQEAADAAKRLNGPASLANVFGDLRRSAADALPKFAKLGETIWDGFNKAAASNWQKLTDDAKAVFDSTRTPLEQLRAERERLDRLHRLGLVNDDTFARAMTDAAKKASDALGFGGQAKGVEAMERRSGFQFNAAPQMVDPLRDIASATRGTEAATREQARNFGELLRRLRANGETINLDDLLGQVAGG